MPRGSRANRPCNRNRSAYRRSAGAVLLASMTMFCGSAAIDKGHSGRACLVISTVSRETSQDCPGAAPISTGRSAGRFFGVMVSPRVVQFGRSLRRAGDAFYKVVHRLDGGERHFFTPRAPATEPSCLTSGPVQTTFLPATIVGLHRQDLACTSAGTAEPNGSNTAPRRSRGYRALQRRLPGSGLHLFDQLYLSSDPQFQETPVSQASARGPWMSTSFPIMWIPRFSAVCAIVIGLSTCSATTSMP